MNDQWTTLETAPARASFAAETSPPAITASEPTRAAENYSTLDVVNFLLTRSSMDDVAQFLVLQQLAALHPWQMSIYELGTDSLLRLIGSFGHEQGKGDLHEKSCLEDSPVGTALRDGLPQANFPLTPRSGLMPLRVIDSENGPQMLWPLLTSHRLCGVLQLRFGVEPDASQLQSAMCALAPPIALVVDLQNDAGGYFGPSLDGMFSLGGGHQLGGGRRLTAIPGGRRSGRPSTLLDHPVLGATQPGPEDLTARQMQVLEYMSQGMTNGQIARMLKFSESTVRQETMAIYRALQVGGRVEAVAYARELGILPK